MADSAAPVKVNKPDGARTLYSNVNLPALLNDPRLARRELDFFTKTWGEAFDAAGIVTVKDDSIVNREDFKRYAKKVLRHLRKASKQKKLGESGANQNVPENNLDEDDKIPKIFFLSTFSLENPALFTSVVQTTDFPTFRTDVRAHSNLNSSVKPTQSIKLQHERLSFCLDAIESKLAKQISAKSDMLFSMAKFQNDLQENMRRTTAAAHFLRGKTQAVQKNISGGPLKMLRLVKSKSALNAIMVKLQLITTLHQTKPTLQLMIETNEFVGALELAQTSKEILTQELEGVTCFRYLFSELTEMEGRAIQMMEHYFRSCIQSDLQTIGMSVAEDSTIQQERISAVIACMVRLGKVEFLSFYHEDICDFLKSVVKEKIMQAVSLANISAQPSLADQMRLLNYTQWSELLSRILDTLLAVLQRVMSFATLVNGIASKLGAETSQGQAVNVPTAAASLKSTTSAANGKIASIVQDTIVSINDHVQERCAKVLSARAKDGFLERLLAPEFVALWQRIGSCTESCEALTGLKCSTLRAAVQHQASQFVTRFHNEQKTKLSLILDNERWRQANVPIAFQQLVDHVQSTSQLRLCDMNTADDSMLLESQHKEYLVVDGRKFVVVGTALMLLKMMVEYCQHAEDMPSVAWNILTQLVELIKMFNSRTCQLILGAGALQMVGLKTISVRNLALASSCLQLVVYYLPIVQKFFHSRVDGRQLNIIRYFEQITKDYKDHMSEIDNQLVAVISSMIEQNLSKVDLRQGVQNVVKQMIKCHESLCDALPDSQLAAIFTRIHAVFVACYNKQRTANSTNGTGVSGGDIAGASDGSVKQPSELLLYLDTVGALSGLSTVDLTVGITSN